MFGYEAVDLGCWLLYLVATIAQLSCGEELQLLHIVHKLVGGSESEGVIHIAYSVYSHRVDIKRFDPNQTVRMEAVDASPSSRRKYR